MKIYNDFYGETPIKQIGKKLREIVKKEKKSFKVLTGYGSTSGISQSKNAVIKSLSKMKREGIINGFFPGEVKHMLLTTTSPYYESKLKYEKEVKNDSDYGNDGVVFIFVA